MPFNIVFDTICTFNKPDNNQSSTENVNSKTHVENINDHFKLPIFYNEHKVALKQNIVDDLELIKTIDMSCIPVYHHL